MKRKAILYGILSAWVGSFVFALTFIPSVTITDVENLITILLLFLIGGILATIVSLPASLVIYSLVRYFEENKLLSKVNLYLISGVIAGLAGILLSLIFVIYAGNKGSREVFIFNVVKVISITILLGELMAYKLRNEFDFVPVKMNEILKNKLIASVILKNRRFLNVLFVIVSGIVSLLLSFFYEHSTIFGDRNQVFPNIFILGFYIGLAFSSWILIGGKQRIAFVGGWQLGVLSGYLVWFFGRRYIWAIEIILKSTFGENAGLFTSIIVIAILFSVMRIVSNYGTHLFNWLIEKGQEWEQRKAIQGK